MLLLQNIVCKKVVCMIIYETKNWSVVFANKKQNFLGRCKIVNKKGKNSLSELTKEEWQELGVLEKTLEIVCKELFGATMFNFACLINFAYRDKVEPIVHFQFVPRYDNVVKIFGKKYKDKRFGYKLWRWYNNKFKHQKTIFSKTEINKIYDMMKTSFNSKINIKKY